MSDYGRSTIRLMQWATGLTFVFAVIYMMPLLFGTTPFVTNLDSVTIDKVPVSIPVHVVPVRAVYFSVVTMTTLGFGDIHATPTSMVGHFLLMAQAVLGFVLLGALVTRISNLIQGVGLPPLTPPIHERERPS